MTDPNPGNAVEVPLLPYTTPVSEAAWLVRNTLDDRVRILIDVQAYEQAASRYVWLPATKCRVERLVERRTP